MSDGLPDIEHWELVATAIRTRARIRGVRLHDDVIEDFAKTIAEAVSPPTQGAVDRAEKAEALCQRLYALMGEEARLTLLGELESSELLRRGAGGSSA